MATIPFCCPTPSSIPLTKNTFIVCSKPYLSSSSSLRSSSLAIKCTKHDGNVSGDPFWSKKGNNMMYSMPVSWFNELKKVKVFENFVSNLADPMGKLAKKELDQLQTENKKMKHVINHFKIKGDEVDQLKSENKNMKEYIDHVIKTKVDQVQTENEKMTQHIEYLKAKVNELEKCEKKVSEAQILLVELDCALQVIKQALLNDY